MNATYAVEVKSFDGEPVAASFISLAGKSSDEESLDVGLAVQNGVDLAARNWKLLFESRSFENGYISVFNPSSRNIASIKFSNQESVLPLGMPEEIELDGLESVSFSIMDTSIKTLDIDSSSAVVGCVLGCSSSGFYLETGRGVSNPSPLPLP